MTFYLARPSFGIVHQTCLILRLVNFSSLLVFSFPVYVHRLFDPFSGLFLKTEDVHLDSVPNAVISRATVSTGPAAVDQFRRPAIPSSDTFAEFCPNAGTGLRLAATFDK